MNCRNSDLPDTAMAPSCDCGRSLSDISGPGPVVRPVANFCFDDNDWLCARFSDLFGRKIYSS